MNSIGSLFRLTTFGESHGPAMGGIIDGMPPGIRIDFDEVNKEIAKRRPGTSALTTARNEQDKVEFLSGLSAEGVTLGTPIGFIIRNTDHHSSDYDCNADKFRPNHADYTYLTKYGIREHRGGGRASARETVSWVVGGAMAREWLKSLGVRVEAILSQVGPVALADPFAMLRDNTLDTPHLVDEPETHQKMLDVIAAAKKAGDSVGGSVACAIYGIRAGLGEPMFDKLQSRLAAAMLSLNAVKSFEYGLGSQSASSFGSQTSDLFNPQDAGHQPLTKTNYSGGIQGGISNGMPVYFSVAFKPTPTLLRDLPTIDTTGHEAILKAKGRHDPCVALRGLHVVKALAYLVIADMMRLSRS